MCRSPQRPEDNLVPLKLELQAVLSHRVGAWDQAPSFVRTETAPLRCLSSLLSKEWAFS